MNNVGCVYAIGSPLTEIQSLNVILELPNDRRIRITPQNEWNGFEKLGSTSL